MGRFHLPTMSNRRVPIVILLATFLAAVPSHAQSADSARAWIRSLYSAYTHDGKGIPYDEKNGGRWFDASLVALMRADKKAVGDGYVTAYSDADVFCGCQDWDGIWDLKINIRMNGANRATADVSFALAQPPSKDAQQRVRFELIRERGQWRIDDVCDSFGEKDMLCLRKAIRDEIASLPSAQPCTIIHGRAHLYGADGRLRIWHIGTHHEYTPDDSSWDRVMKWIEAGITKSERPIVTAPSLVYLYADFEVCPTEPFKEGSVQQAKVLSAAHRHYVHTLR